MDDTPKHWNQGSFGAGVKIGNWNEDMYLREEELSDYLLRNASGDLGFHKTDALLKMARTPSQVSSSVGGNVCFGSQCMLVNPKANAVLSTLPSVHVGVHEVAGESMMCTAAKMGEADMHMPVTRNVFTVVPADGAADGGEARAVNFGETFYLRAEHPTEPGRFLYLYSETPHINSAVSRITKQQVVNLKPSTDGLNKHGFGWTFMLQDPDFRLESEGTPVPANVEVCVKHVQSGQCLAANSDVKPIVSEFGAEIEVTAKTNMGRAQVEAPENHWVAAMKA